MILELNESESRELQRAGQRALNQERRAADDFQIAIGSATQKFMQARLGARQENDETIKQIVEAKGQSFDKVTRYNVDLVNKKVVLTVVEELPKNE